MNDRVYELGERKRMLREGGGPDRINKQHAAGKLTARQRIEELVDPGSFDELMLFAEHRATLFGMDGRHFPGEAVVTGTGSIDDRPVHLASQDSTVAGGSAGAVHCDKIAEMMKSALDTGTPFILFNDSAGARVQEGIDSLAAYGRVYRMAGQLSGIVPQISVVCGTCAGGAAYIPAMMDFVIQTRQARMYVTGPDAIAQVTGENVELEKLASPDTHMRDTGVTHFIAEDDFEAAGICRRLLSFLPSHNGEHRHEPYQEAIEPDEFLNTLIPADPEQAYDMKDVIRRVVDEADFLEVHEGFAQNMVVGFARIAGRSVGIIANQPSVLSGCIDIDGSRKAARFVQMCDAFNVPLVTFVDVPGFLPGVAQETGGVIHHVADLLRAYSRCRVPVLTVIVRKAYGGACLAMGARHVGAQRAVAWPSAEIAVMGVEGAASIVFGREREQPVEPEARRQELVEHYRTTLATPYIAAAGRLVDDVIEPAQTRPFLARALAVAGTAMEPRRD
jgi:methylmalonyl-CoA carboxyltransferase 12S subunit